jgi:Flp pilus assembly protein TadD
MQGNLAKQQLPKIIRSINHDAVSGILELSRNSIHKQIYFGQGSMVFASSDYRADRLGEFLVRNGKLTRTHLDIASDKVFSTGNRLGETMVSMGLMSQQEMLNGVNEQVRSIIYSLFMWDRGDYRFESKEKPITKELEMSFPTYSTILEGVRRIQDPAAIQRALGSLDRVVNHRKNPSMLPDAVALSPEESYVLSRVDGQSSVAEIVAISPIEEIKTLKCLYGLLSVGVLELGNKSRELAPSKKLSFSHPPDHQATPRTKERVAPPAADGSPEEQWIRQDIVKKCSALTGGTFYDWLEVRRMATTDEVKKAYRTMIKTYHPDRLYSKQLEDLHGSLEEIITKITNAHEVLADSVARKRYDNSLRTEAPRGEDLRPREQPAPPVKEHKAEDVSKRTAKQHYKEAKKRFAEGDYHVTAELMDVCLRLDPDNTSYHKLQAQALAKNPNWTKDAQEHYQKVLSEDPSDVEALVGLAEIYEANGLARKSERMFFRALGLDPENEELRERLAKKNRLPKWKKWMKQLRNQ